MLAFWLPMTSNMVCHRSIKKLDLKMWGSRWNVISVPYRRYQFFWFGAAILNFWLPVTSNMVCHRSIKKLHPENKGVAVGISF
jgi:hypothetical protein